MFCNNFWECSNFYCDIPLILVAQMPLRGIFFRRHFIGGPLFDPLPQHVQMVFFLQKRKKIAIDEFNLGKKVLFCALKFDYSAPYTFFSWIYKYLDHRQVQVDVIRLLDSILK